jgi:hypothetical protein
VIDDHRAVLKALEIMPLVDDQDVIRLNPGMGLTPGRVSRAFSELSRLGRIERDAEFALYRLAPPARRSAKK